MERDIIIEIHALITTTALRLRLLLLLLRLRLLRLAPPTLLITAALRWFSLAEFQLRHNHFIVAVSCAVVLAVYDLKCPAGDTNHLIHLQRFIVPLNHAFFGKENGAVVRVNRFVLAITIADLHPLRKVYGVHFPRPVIITAFLDVRFFSDYTCYNMH
ncbi:single-stranded DNA binding protein [Klebsiella phage vB_KshKPC-M]|nr:single-stranded DNA binding protein [Klebsiella phage vB_KshKPC-M]